MGFSNPGDKDTAIMDSEHFFSTDLGLLADDWKVGGWSLWCPGIDPRYYTRVLFIQYWGMYILETHPEKGLNKFSIHKISYPLVN